jgi:hypothetical protein
MPRSFFLKVQIQKDPMQGSSKVQDFQLRASMLYPQYQVPLMKKINSKLITMSEIDYHMNIIWPSKPEIIFV